VSCGVPKKQKGGYTNPDSSSSRLRNALSMENITYTSNHDQIMVWSKLSPGCKVEEQREAASYRVCEII